MTKLLQRSSLALLAASALVGCVATTHTSSPRGVIVAGPPPAGLSEERPPSPLPDALWIKGYWHWTGIQYAWIPGHWEAHPPRGAEWQTPRYTSANGAYFYEPGRWRDGHSPPAAPR